MTDRKRPDDPDSNPPPTPQMISDQRRETPFRPAIDQSEIARTRKTPAYQPPPITRPADDAKAKDKADGDPLTPPTTYPSNLQFLFEGLRSDIVGLFDGLQGQVMREVIGLRSEVRKNANLSFEEHHKTRKQVAQLTTISHHLWAKVYGSEPPPPPPMSSTPSTKAGGIEAADDAGFAFEESTDTARRTLRDLDDQVSKHDTTLEAVHGQVLVLSGQLATAQTELKNVHETMDQQLKLQKEQMGHRDEGDTRGFLQRFGDGIVWVMKERDGKKFFLQLIAATTGLVTMIGYLAALYLGRPFVPTPSVALPSVPAPAALPTAPPAPPPTITADDRRPFGPPPAPSATSSGSTYHYR